jgi:CheY-like chemotaxis protein
VAISGNCTPGDVEKGLAAGFQGFLAKPINLEKFNQSLKKHLG